MPNIHQALIKLAVTTLSLSMLWVLAAFLVGDAQHLPAPTHVVQSAMDEMLRGTYWTNMGATLSRVVLACAIALVLGGMLGAAMAAFRRGGALLSPVLKTLQQLPLLVVAVLWLTWLDVSELSIILALALLQAARIAQGLAGGLATLDPRLGDMAQVYRMPSWARLRHVIWPQIAPAVHPVTQAAFRAIWMPVLLIEALWMTQGVGVQILVAYASRDLADVFAYALPYSLIMVGLEQCINLGFSQRVRAHPTKPSPTPVRPL